MPIKSKLTGLGIAASTAQNIAGTVATPLVATGSTQATALLLSLDDIQLVTTTAASTGVILLPGTTTLPTPYSAGDSVTIANYGANALSIYPPTGGKIANGTTNAAISLAANKTGVLTNIDGTNWLSDIGA